MPSAVEPSPKFHMNRTRSSTSLSLLYARPQNSVSAPTMTVRSSPPSANICIFGGVADEEAGGGGVVLVVVVCVCCVVFVWDVVVPVSPVEFESLPEDEAVSVPVPGVGDEAVNA